MLRARDAMDRHFAEPLDVAAVAAIAHTSEAHFSRTFKATFGESPHRYLQRRRVERLAVEDVHRGLLLQVGARLFVEVDDAPIEISAVELASLRGSLKFEACVPEALLRHELTARLFAPGSA